jgi:hypothetical protein
MMLQFYLSNAYLTYSKSLDSIRSQEHPPSFLRELNGDMEETKYFLNSKKAEN